MGKNLTEMSLEELWELFPICLTAPDEKWSEYYDEMKTILYDKLNKFEVKRISHIGSTSIKGIWAKPIIDIMVEIADISQMEAVANEIVVSAGFIEMSRQKNRISFNCGYTESGFAKKVYHLHLREVGDNDELYFRDYLNQNSEIAEQYQKLKINLWHKYEHNRDAYTRGKTNFVNSITEKAKQLYANKYS